MGKSIRLVTLVLIAAVCFSCGNKNNYEKDILGTWVSMDNDVKEGDAQFNQELTFFDDDRFEEQIEGTMRENVNNTVSDVYMLVKMEGTWKIKRNILSLNYNGSVEMLDYKIDYPEMGEEERAEEGDQLGILSEEEEIAVIKAMENTLPKGDQRYPNLKIDGNTLSYTAINGIQSFTRKQ